MERNNFFGLSGFVWWMGRVVNNVDPLGLGRCQVRIFGWHTDNKMLLPDSDLPWAMAVYPINNPHSFDVPDGETATGRDDGDWVIGFFMDGESAQVPIMLGVIPGLKAQPQGG